MTAPSMAEAPALLGRRSRYEAGGHGTTGTGLESLVPRAPSGGGGAGLLPQKVLRTFWGPEETARW